jgi:hypothetical protein
VRPGRRPEGAQLRRWIGLEGTDGQTTVTVTFTDSGQPQSITAPASS